MGELRNSLLRKQKIRTIFVLISFVVVISVSSLISFFVYNSTTSKLIRENEQLSQDLYELEQLYSSDIIRKQSLENDIDYLENEIENLQQFISNIEVNIQGLLFEKHGLTGDLNNANIEKNNKNALKNNLTSQLSYYENIYNSLESEYIINLPYEFESIYYQGFGSDDDELDYLLDTLNSQVIDIELNEYPDPYTIKVERYSYDINYYTDKIYLFYYALNDSGQLIASLGISYKHVLLENKYYFYSLPSREKVEFEQFGFPINYREETYYASENVTFVGMYESYMYLYNLDYTIGENNLSLTTYLYFYEGIEVDDIVYTYNENGDDSYFSVGHDLCYRYYAYAGLEILYLSCAENELNEYKIHIPKEIYYIDKYVPVTKIENYAFRGSEAKTIFLPEHINEIGEFAFANSSIEEIFIENDQGVIQIGMNIFDTNTLVTMYVPENLYDDYVLKYNDSSDIFWNSLNLLIVKTTD